MKIELNFACLNLFILTALSSCKPTPIEESSEVKVKTRHFEYANNSMFTLKQFHVRVMPQWYDMKIKEGSLEEKEMQDNVKLFIRFEGRNADVVATSHFYEKFTIHCKDNPQKIAYSYDVVSKKSTHWVIGPIENPCIELGGIYKMTTHGELVSTSENLATATLEYLYTKNPYTKALEPKYNENSRHFPGNYFRSEREVILQDNQVR